MPLTKGEKVPGPFGESSRVYTQLHAANLYSRRRVTEMCVFM